jgi:hypothetical protein
MADSSLLKTTRPRRRGLPNAPHPHTMTLLIIQRNYQNGVYNKDLKFSRQPIILVIFNRT